MNGALPWRPLPSAQVGPSPPAMKDCASGPSFNVGNPMQRLQRETLLIVGSDETCPEGEGRELLRAQACIVMGCYAPSLRAPASPPPPARDGG